MSPIFTLLTLSQSYMKNFLSLLYTFLIIIVITIDNILTKVKVAYNDHLLYPNFLVIQNNHDLFFHLNFYNLYEVLDKVITDLNFEFNYFSIYIVNPDFNVIYN